MSAIKYRASHRIIIAGKTYEQDDFLPENLDAETIEQLHLSNAIYNASTSTEDEVAPEKTVPINSEAPKKRTQK